MKFKKVCCIQSSELREKSNDIEKKKQKNIYL